MKTKVICFGAANGGKDLYAEISKRYEVVCFTDNDARKWGKSLQDHEIVEPRIAVFEKKYDEIIVTSAPGCLSIKEQLLDMGVPEEKIITSYVDSMLKSRIVFLESFAKIINEKNSLDGACAEVGVFQGDFAKCINANFSDRTLYLFDTFEGFKKEDIAEEKKRNLSEAEISDYSNSSVEMVLKKMPFPEKCIIRKGYFPETATDVDDEFYFVNLDVDLYLPTLNGLKWFRSRMKKGGVILIHDYFATNFRGPRQAVDEFMQLDESKGLSMCPIGDGISVMIIGF